MKAILVFDVNEFTYDAIKEYFTGVIDLHLGKDGFIDFEDVILKPLPQYLPRSKYWGRKVANYRYGWNCCLDEILGGSDDNVSI